MGENTPLGTELPKGRVKWQFILNKKQYLVNNLYEIKMKG